MLPSLLILLKRERELLVITLFYASVRFWNGFSLVKLRNYIEWSFIFSALSRQVSFRFCFVITHTPHTSYRSDITLLILSGCFVVCVFRAVIWSRSARLSLSKSVRKRICHQFDRSWCQLRRAKFCVVIWPCRLILIEWRLEFSISLLLHSSDYCASSS